MDNNIGFESTVQDFSIEMETGIFNMVVTLCQHKASFIPIQDAKEQVALYLEKLIVGLRYNEQDPLKGK